MVGGGGAGSPQMVQKRALARLMCPQGQGRSVPDVPIVATEAPEGVLAGCIGDCPGRSVVAGAPNADKSSACCGVPCGRCACWFCPARGGEDTDDGNAGMAVLLLLRRCTAKTRRVSKARTMTVPPTTMAHGKDAIVGIAAGVGVGVDVGCCGFSCCAWVC